MIIYRLIFRSGKSYIGQTIKTMEHRVLQHRNAANAGSILAVHCAWRLHGAPEAEVLSVHGTMDDLHAAEIAAIAAFGTLTPGGYNLSFGGDTAPSTRPEVAAKIAAKAKGRIVSAAAKARGREATSARWEDPEYRARVAEGVERAWTPERRAAAGARSAARKGGKRSAATREKISTAMTNPSAETRAKMSASAKSRARAPFSEDHCAKITSHVTASWQDPEIRARRSAAIRAAWQRKRANATAQETTS